MLSLDCVVRSESLDHQDGLLLVLSFSPARALQLQATTTAGSRPSFSLSHSPSHSHSSLAAQQLILQSQPFSLGLLCLHLFFHLLFGKHSHPSVDVLLEFFLPLFSLHAFSKPLDAACVREV